MAKAAAATAIAQVNIAAVAPSIGLTHAQVKTHRQTLTTVAHPVTREQLAQRALSKVMTPHAKAVAIHAAVVASVATKLIPAKKTLKSPSQPTRPRTRRQAVQRRHPVSHGRRVRCWCHSSGR